MTRALIGVIVMGTVSRTMLSAPPPPTPKSPTVAASPVSPLVKERATVRVQAIRVADDDGKRRCDISPEQVAKWVEYANGVYKIANVSFVFDPKKDFADVKSTIVNNLAGQEQKGWWEAVAAGNDIAAAHRGKMTILFRYGRGLWPTGGGFSSFTYDFAAVPGFNNTSVCEHQNISLFAHEIGHYFMLGHTFGQQFGTLKEAEAFLAKNKDDPNCFDGDGLGDTAAAPMIVQYCCGDIETVKMNGKDVALGRTNIMTYYDSEVKTLSPKQVERVRWMLAYRAKHGMSVARNSDVFGALSFEDLEIKDAHRVTSERQDMRGYQPPWGWQGEAQALCHTKPVVGPAPEPGAAEGDDANKSPFITYVFPVAKAGMYQVSLYATMSRDYGIVQVAVDGIRRGKAVDLFAPEVLPTGRINLAGEKEMMQLDAGKHTITVEVIGRNERSGGELFGVDCLALVRVESGRK